MRKIELVKQELSAHLIPSEIDWAFELADLAERADLSLVVLRRCASDLAWLAREIGQRFPDDDDWARCDSAANPGAARRALAYVHGFRLRFDFKFDQLERMTRVWLADVPDDALIHSLAAFAALGQLSDRAEPLLRQAVATPGYDTTCRWVCLHGLWFGTNLPDQAERIIELSDEMTGRGEDRANLYYWRAFALRRLGRLEEATVCVDRAIALLPVGMNSVHQDYVRERELINTTRMFHEQLEGLTENLSERLRRELQDRFTKVKEDLDQQSASARRMVSESLLGLVEILALFVTLAGFLVGSGAIVLQAKGFGQNLIAIVLLLGGSLLFFLLIRGVVRLDRPSSRGLGLLLRGLVRVRGKSGGKE